MISIAKALVAGKARLRAARVDESDLSAELLLAFALGKDRRFLFLEPQSQISEQKIEEYHSLLQRRIARCPVAYIVGEQEFYGVRFEVNEHVLIPRPETEILVGRALECLQAVSGQPCLLDVGTGSGCIAIAIALQNPHARSLAIDRSEAALQVARRNAIRHGVAERIHFLRSDLLSGLRESKDFDLVLSNPPYVDPGEKSTLMPEVRDFEPAQALFAPAGHPTFFHERIAELARARLRPGGRLLMELGLGQAPMAKERIKALGYQEVGCWKDFQRIDRVLEASTPKS